MRTLALLTILVALLCSCSSVNIVGGGGDSADPVASMLARLNTARAAKGLPALTTHPTLMKVTQDQANHNASKGENLTQIGGSTLGWRAFNLGYIPRPNEISLAGSGTESGVGNTWLSDTALTDAWDNGQTDIGLAFAKEGNLQYWVAFIADEM